MDILQIRKLSAKTWKHVSTTTDGAFILSKFYVKTEGDKFIIVEWYGAKRREYTISQIEVYDIGGSAETFTNFEDLFLRLEALSYPAFYFDGATPTNFLSNNIDTYATATLPLSDTDKIIVFQGGVAKEVAKSEIDRQIYKTINTNTSLDNTYHNSVIWVTAICNITIPSGLRSDFNCTFRTFTGVTATFLTSGTTISSESDGDVQAPKTMSYIAQYSTNNYIISGGGLS